MILPLFLTVALVQTSYGQSKAEKISVIRQICNKINNDKTLRKKTIDDIQAILGYHTDGGGELIGYFDKTDVPKMTLSVGFLMA
jgi:hypothetical protein